MIKNKNLEQIINLFKNNQFDEALRLCDQNSDKSIGHIILNFKGAIYFKQKNFELAKKNFLKSIELNEDFIDPLQLEDRVYRFRCVEAWSMVVPWVGIPLAKIIKQLNPTSKAKYVAFQTLLDSEQMPSQKVPILDWPYVEGLRIDEAMNPLTLIAVGIFGEELPNQNGAPLRLVVPWKYGFKGIKSIVKISFVEQQPKSTWNIQAPNEYGFYSNVNPQVDHPRWSQKRERLITGEGGFAALFSKKIDTLMFNGYAEEVADLYKGLDLYKHF